MLGVVLTQELKVLALMKGCEKLPTFTKTGVGVRKVVLSVDGGGEVSAPRFSHIVAPPPPHT